MRNFILTLIFVVLILTFGCTRGKTEINEEGIMITNGVKHTVELDKIINVLPRDVIPSIDNPKFISLEEANKILDDNEIIFGVVFNNDARAYPQKILNWHEIVNDKVGNTPIAVTFCPLCGSGIVFKRVINDKETTFGVSGKLYNSDLVMYDRLTNTFWSQIDGTAIMGDLAGQQLEILSVIVTTWNDWKKTYSNTKVLSRDTGFIRDYDEYPYGNYETSAEIYFPVSAEDSRLHPKSRVYGIEINKKFKAYPKEEIKKVKIINDEFNGKNILVVYNEDIDDVKIFDRLNKEFKLEDGKLVSNNFEYTIEGKSNSGNLEEIKFVNVFWFAWFAFHPDTEVYFS